MGEKRRWGNWDQSKLDDNGRWPSKSPRHWGQQNQAGFRSWREDERSGKLTSNGWGDSYHTVPSWERTFCSYVCRVPWRKICDADRVLYIYKNVAKWDDSAGREAFHNAKARYWAKINHLPCNIPLPDPDMYIEKVDFDTFIDPELAADIERSFVNPDTDVEPVINHLDSLEDKPMAVTRCGEAEQSSSNWDKHIEKPVPASLWDDMGVNNGWGNGIVQCDSWQSRRNHSMYVNGKETSHRVSWKDQDESWRHHDSWKDCQDRRNSSWNHTNSGYPVDDHQRDSSWKCSGRNSRNNTSFEKVQPHKTLQLGQFLVPRNHQRTGYSGPQFQPENAVS
ncbi:uncharacterized protein LOC110092192 [Dendrobium catenatum]|uniref:Uncharacterized protein n=1 Tax=Dendrobium catenatum TaxID=906689 RepID=A0A2I0WT59_9ASPA|nr:uncharacterized protein LOC110092192 [Dendrobium catenatum]PKU78844.1 hypothetical protein MA16_Dca000187 [Dendrobium catenatum]